MLVLIAVLALIGGVIVSGAMKTTDFSDRDKDFER
jgi:hypothetical protein